MESQFDKIIKGYKLFRDKYAQGDRSIMGSLSRDGQKPEIMVVACCDSRVDPALILQCEPGDLFVIRNVANIVPPYEKDEKHHGTSAALEFGMRFLNIKHLILLGHSQCGGIQALLNNKSIGQNDFITNWVSLIQHDSQNDCHNVDTCAKASLQQSQRNCLTFPWIKEKVNQGQLTIHLWFFDIKMGKIFEYHTEKNRYELLQVKRQI